MIASRRRKWRCLSLGLLVLVLLGTLTLLLHLWSSAADIRKNPLQQHDYKSDAVLLRDDNRGAVPQDKVGVPQDDSSNAVPLDDNQLDAVPHDKLGVPQDDSSNAVPLDDNQLNAVPQDKLGVPQDDSSNAVPLDDNQPVAVPQDKNARPPDDNKNAGPIEDDQRDAVPVEGNKGNAVPLDESNTAVPPEKSQPGEVPLNEKKNDIKPQTPQYGQAYLHGELVTKNSSKADLQTNDHPMKLVQPGSTRENTGENKIPGLGPGPPTNMDLSADEFMGKREVQGPEAELLLPTVPLNKTDITDSSADVSSIQGPVLASRGKDIHNVTNLFSGSLMNEMNRNDFAADAEQNVHFPLPTKSTFLDTNGNGWKADSNSTDEFNSGLQFPRQNSSNFQSSVSTDGGGGIRIVSMSLYGAQLRYTVGAVRNAELVKENFPGWTLRIYMESPASSTPRFGLVPRNVVEKLRSLGVDIHYIVPEQDFIPPMMWRFLVADDLSVDYFIIRDSDSRLTQRDAAAVLAWIRSGKPFHSIRDHPSHANYAVSGGLWGGRTKELRDILRRSWIDLMRGASSQYLEDMNFLNNVIWPRVQFHAYCSDSVSCDRWPNSYPFPVARYGYDHVGQVFNEHDLGRPIDIRILRVAGENPQCTSTNGS